MKVRATSRYRASLPLVALAGVVFVAAGCSEHQDPAGPSGAGDIVEIEVRNFAFSAATVTIAPGTTVRWRNATASFHTVTPDGHSQWEEWQTAGVDETFEVRFDQTGNFPYYCVPHRALGMTGTIVVE